MVRSKLTHRPYLLKHFFLDDVCSPHSPWIVTGHLGEILRENRLDLKCNSDHLPLPCFLMSLILTKLCLHSNLSPVLLLDHVIKDVNSGSPAAMAGLKDNDILVAVNGERVDGLDHESVVGKIKQSEERTSLLVVDKETDSMYKLVRSCKLLLGIDYLSQ